MYRGRRRRVRRSSGSPAIAAFLSFLWPGLGHAYLRRWARAIVFAIPPAVLLIATIFVVAQDPGAFALKLLAPSFGLLVIGLIAIHAVWRVAAIFDTWRLTRSGGAAFTDRLLPLVVLLSLIVFAAHVTVGTFVQSFADAGAKIFTSDRPQGTSEIDEILGGNDPGDSSGGGILASEDANGDGRMDGDLNGDGVINNDDDLNDDGVINGDDVDIGDINGDGLVDDNDVPASGEPIDGDTNGDGVVDEEDDVDVGVTGPGPSFDPSLTPPPLEPETGIPSAPGNGPINVLFVGVDSGFDRGHALTDTLLVASYYPQQNSVTMISLPRDTGRLPLYTGGVYPQRVNTFLGYAGRHPEVFPEGAISALMRQVGYLLGTTIHYYAATNLEGMPPAVDAVGGVDIVVDKAIDSVKSNYHLAPGTYHFNGVEAMTYARIRYGSSDFARARRQQQVIRALAQRVDEPAVAVRLPQVINALSELVRTNAPRDQIPALVRILERANDASTENIVLSPIAGYARRIPAAEVNGRYMIELNIAAIRELSIRVFGPHSQYH